MEFLLYIFKSAGVLLLFYVVYFFWLQKDTLFQAKRQFLFFGLLTAIFLPLLEFTKTVVLEIPELTESVNNGAVAITGIQPQATNFSFTVWDLLVAIYIVGVLFMSFRFFKELYLLVRIFKSGNPERIDGVLHIKTDQNHSPFSFFNYIVYNPSIHTEKELQMIIKHEKVHANQWHSADIILANLLLIMQWINPFAWLFKNSIEENLEFIADNQTVQQIPSKKAYQLALVKASSTYPTPALTNNFYQSFIKKRIIMLNKRNSRKVNVLKIGIILPLLALFLWSFNVKEVVTYKTIPATKTEAEKPVIEETSAVKNTPQKELKEEPETTIIKSEKPSIKTEQPEKIAQSILEKYSVKIDKNTTNAEFEKIKKEVKEKYGVDLSYTVVRNDANEIVSLTMNYASAGGENGRSGNYNVNDDDGIEEFNFYLDDEGKSGFWSESTEIRRVERLERRTREMEERKKELELRKEERKVKMKDRKKELKKRQKEIEKRKNNQVAIVTGDNNDGRVYEYVLANSSRGSNVAVVSGSYENSIVINKNTSDVELAKMKEELASENIKFTYKNVKRNAIGEITGLKITIDNNKGSKSTSVIKSDDDEPIEQIVINQ